MCVCVFLDEVRVRTCVLIKADDLLTNDDHSILYHHTDMKETSYKRGHRAPLCTGVLLAVHNCGLSSACEKRRRFKELEAGPKRGSSKKMSAGHA